MKVKDIKPIPTEIRQKYPDADIELLDNGNWKLSYTEIISGELPEKKHPGPKKGSKRKNLAIDAIDLSTFTIKTPAHDGELYHVSCSGRKAAANSLRNATLDLMQTMGIAVESLGNDAVKLIEKFPDSPGKAEILAILEAA